MSASIASYAAKVNEVDEGRGVGTLFGLTVVGRIVLGLNVVGLVDDGFDVGMSVVVDDGLRDVGLVVGDDGLRDVGLVVGILSRVGEYVG